MIRGGSTLGLGRIVSGDAGRIDSGADRPVSVQTHNASSIIKTAIYRIVSSDFPASVVLLSQSLQFPKHKKSVIKRFFYFPIHNSR